MPPELSFQAPPVSRSDQTIWQALLAPLRQRYPFLPPLVSALCGIILSSYVGWPSGVWLAVALLGTALFFLYRPALGFALLAFGIFGAVHLWQSRESPAELLSRKLTAFSPFAEVVGIVDNEPRIFSEKRAGFRPQRPTVPRGTRVQNVCGQDAHKRRAGE